MIKSLLRNLLHVVGGFLGIPLVGGVVALVAYVSLDEKRFEAPAKVKSVSIVCKYWNHPITGKGRALTGYIPCVPKDQVAKKAGRKNPDMVSFTKDTVAFLDVQQEGMAPHPGFIVTAFNFVGHDPLAVGTTQSRYENLLLEPGDRIIVGYHAAERDPERERFFFVAHQD